MTTFPETAKKVAVAAVLGVGILVRVLFLAGADEHALVSVVPDDAYYYFQIARNVAAGDGPTFDRIHPTNGYHPLWMGVLLPAAGVVREPHLFVRVALGAGVLLGFLTAILLYRLVRRMTAAPDLVGLPRDHAPTLPLPPPCKGGGCVNPSPSQGEGRERVGPAREGPYPRNQGASWWIPLLALILYWLNPRAVVSSLNGLETSLSTLLFTVLLWATVGIADCGLRIADLNPKSEIRNPKWAPLFLGLLMGLLFLARTDNVFFIGVFWLAAVAMAERAERLRWATVMAAAACALAVPWVAYNWIAFGSPIQVSGLSIPYVHHALYRPEDHGGLSPVLYGLKQFAVMLYEGLRGEIGYSRLVSFPAIALSLLVFALAWRRREAMPPLLRRVILLVLGLGVASLAHLFVHSAIRWYPRPWYFDQLLVLLPVLFALALAVLARGAGIPDSRFQIPDSRLPNTQHRAPNTGNRATPPSPTPHSAFRTPHFCGGLAAILLAGLAAFQMAAGARLLARGEWPWATEMLDAARWLRDNTRKDAVAAAFNAGIIGYYSERQVVNLDGAVNNAAYAALRRKDLLGLMRQAGVSHYLDFEPMTLDRFRPFLGDLAVVKMPVVLEIRRPGADWAGSNIRIHKLVWLPEGTK